MMVKYFINFWIWWYVVKAYDIASELVVYWSFVLNYINLPLMTLNLFVPLYQDESLVGKFISFIIRLVWILIGSLLMLILTIPMVSVFILYLLVPIMPVFVIIGTYINWI